jgi:D-tyrosyl-tRNA(Tyr) deacylase
VRALIQRVQFAKVVVDGQTVGEIGPGILTLLGVAPTDTERELEWIITKIAKLRIFEDPQGKMNLALGDVGGSHLIVSQFTLYGDASKGNRPSFIDAARPEIAEPLYQKALELSRAQGLKTEGGKFGADMKVSLLNDGPVTLMLEISDAPN